MIDFHEKLSNKKRINGEPWTPWGNCPTEGNSWQEDDGTCQERGHSHIPHDSLYWARFRERTDDPWSQAPVTDEFRVLGRLRGL